MYNALTKAYSQPSTLSVSENSQRQSLDIDLKEGGKLFKNYYCAHEINWKTNFFFLKNRN